MPHVWVTELMDAETARDLRLRCKLHLQLQIPLPLSLIPFRSLCLQWSCNCCTGFWIRDGGRQVFKTAERNGSASNPGSGAECNVTPWVCLWCSSRGWCPTTACTRRSSCTNFHRGCVADWVEGTCWVISATRELFSEDESVEFWLGIAQAMELLPWKESL